MREEESNIGDGYWRVIGANSILIKNYIVELTSSLFIFLQKGGYIHVRCPKCNNVVYSHHQKINKSGTEIKRNYACSKCKYVFETVEHIIKTDKEE